LIHYRRVFLAELEAIEFLESGQLLEDAGSVVGLSRGWVALEAELLEARTVLNDVGKLADIFDPVVSQIKIGELSLALHVLDLPDEVVVQVQLAEFGISCEAFDLFDLIERQNQSE